MMSALSTLPLLNRGTLCRFAHMYQAFNVGHGTACIAMREFMRGGKSFNRSNAAMSSCSARLFMFDF
jgi:hypothetical protein